MNLELKAFMTIWGNKFVSELKNQLLLKYPYAPGYNDNAYSRGRNKDYSGSASKKATGSLYESIQGNITDDGFELLMNDYWEFVNYGREEGKYVPITPLENWAKLKGFANPRGAAFGISKNIFKFGVKPTNFYETAIDKIQTEFDAEIGGAIERSFTEFFDNLLENTIDTTTR
jgi:hypothetical protein